MDRPDFVYTSYIRTTPERLWQALTDPAWTHRWWTATDLHSDWQVGSPVVWVHHGVTLEDPAQVVLECDPPRRLSFTWHTLTPEWADSVGIDRATQAEIAAEPRSVVTFEIEPVEDLVRLTVLHGNFQPGGRLLGMISQGWPALLPQLKVLHEDEPAA